MRKLSSFLSLALVGLWLVPQSIHADDCQFIPDLFPGQAAGRTETVVNATVHVGEYGPESYDNTHAINQLTSTNENVVATFSERGRNAKVYFVGVGTADVTYTETIERSSCTGVEQTIHYTVNKGVPAAYFRGEDGGPATALTVAYMQGGGGGAEGGGDAAGGGGGSGAYVMNPLMQYKQYSNYHFAPVNIPSGEITYNSTNTDVASISATGAITVNGLGQTTLSASWPGNDNWEAANPTLVLSVKKAPTIYFNPSLINDTAGNIIRPNVVCPEGVTIGSWRSSNTNIATVDNKGNVTLLKAGSVYIYAYSAENAEYASGVCACQINIVKRIPNIYFSPNYVELEYGVTPYAFPELIKPADLDVNLYKWRLSNNDVAYINTNTGALDIFATGHVQVYFYSESNADPKYEPGAASYSLNVTTSGIYVNGVLVNSANPDVLGNNSIIYSVDPLHGKFLTFNDLNYNVTPGSTFIRAEEPLNILVKGNCSISGAGYAIQASSSVFLWCQNNKDTISIEAQYVAIQAGSLKVHDCYLFATAGLYPIYTQSGISVSAGGYIFANATGQNIGGKGTPEAIVANHFIKGEAAIGGIDVLTKGVTFYEIPGEPGTGGFFTNYAAGERATFVEIGKVPLPVKNDKVKDIDFTEENPYDNLDVVFSESKDDKFNEEEKQIEISTVTTDEAVDGALELYVTCSSEWLKLLPGVLVFDVPAGSGEIAIQCELEEGFKLKVTIEGKGTASITQTSKGWALLQYDVLEQTHVIIYLQEEKIKASAPAKAPAKTNDEPVVGAAIKAIKITPSGLAKYYVFGTFNGWEADESYRLTLNEGAAPTTEYMIELPLTTTDQFKVVKVDGENKIWYPDGTDNNYGQHGEIKEDGNYIIYFRPNGDGGDDWFYHVIYVAKQEPTGIDEANTDAQAVKVLRNGQIFILRGDKIYTLTGTEIK